MLVRVIPRSSKNGIEWEQGKLKVRLAAPPVDFCLSRGLGDVYKRQGVTPENLEQKLRGNQ